MTPRDYKINEIILKKICSGYAPEKLISDITDFLTTTYGGSEYQNELKARKKIKAILKAIKEHKGE